VRTPEQHYLHQYTDWTKVQAIVRRHNDPNALRYRLFTSLALKVAQITLSHDQHVTWLIVD